MIAGIGYIVTSIVSIGFPELKTIRSLMTPLYFGEVPIILWMLILGAKVPEVRVAT